MNTSADKTQQNKNQSIVNVVFQKQKTGESTFQFVDKRPEMIAHRKLQDMTNNSQQAKHFVQLQTMSNNYSAQQQPPIQKKENNTGLPDHLKSGIENLSGYSMDDVNVHYNSNRPAQLQAHAYAQGTDIHIASGQEKHLPHEAWHVVQQKQGRVKPTLQLKGKMYVNDDKGLENEADEMGTKAMQMKNGQPAIEVPFIKHLSLVSSSNTVQRMIKKGLKPGTKVKIISRIRNTDKVASIISEQRTGYKVLITGFKMPSLYPYTDLEVIAASVEAIAPVIHHEPVHEVIREAENQQEVADDRIAVDQVAITAAEHHEPAHEVIADSVEAIAPVTHHEPAHEVIHEAENQQEVAEIEVVVREETPIGDLINSILSGDWNSHSLVESIGKQSWEAVKAAWDAIDAGDNAGLKRKKSKFTLVKLRGTRYEAVDDVVESYDGWSDSFMGTQSGHKWGTETEGGGISAKLKLAYRISSVDAVGDADDKKITLKEVLNFFKRSPLIETASYSLALDNVMNIIDVLLRGSEVSLPVEVASKAISGKLTTEITNKAGILAKESRSTDNWPQLRVNGGRLMAKTGIDLNLARFNQYFDSIKVENIKKTQNPQHVTKSGDEENRNSMATELKGIAANLELGTRGKAALSGKPKTSIEFLRHSAMNREQIRHLEKTGADIRNSLRDKLPKGTKFADEELHAIILPKTGVPREIGGYTLATPMTNAFPLLDIGGGKVSALREYR